MTHESNDLFGVVDFDLNVLEDFDIIIFGVGEINALELDFAVDFTGGNDSTRLGYWHVHELLDSITGCVNLEHGAQCQSHLHDVSNHCQEHEEEQHQNAGIHWHHAKLLPVFIEYATGVSNCDKGSIKQSIAHKLENTGINCTAMANQDYSVVGFAVLLDFDVLTMEGLDSSNVAKDFVTHLSKFCLFLHVLPVQSAGHATQVSTH